MGFNQCSLFGSLIDMMTDRLSTLGLSFILSELYPEYVNYFATFSLIDILSHWLQFTSSLESDATSHKQGRYWILSFYYSFPCALLFVCIGQEAFLLLLYIKKHMSYIDSHSEF